MPTLSADLIAQHNLTAAEYARIIERLGREPTLTELGIISVMWSEHCSYKSSRIHLKKLPTQGKYLLVGPGENAGIVDIGGGYAAAFKIESHNHPSFIEPFQGAATGVGGILRDIFTAGSYLIGRLVGKTIPFESRFGGKLTTALQVLSLFALIFWPEAIGLCVILVGMTSVFAIIDYGEAAIRLKAEMAAS